MVLFRAFAAAAIVVTALAGCGQGETGVSAGPAGRATGSPQSPTEMTAFSGAGTGEEECSPNAQCAAANDRPVPDVVGMRVGDACRALARSAYSGGVFAVERGGDAEAGRVAAQDPKPGEGYFEGAMVHLIVSGPFAVEGLPRDSNCVDRTDMGTEQFPVD
jgi:hypothetical protein